MISRFSNIIKFDLQSFFEDYLTFITQDKQLITDYYTKGVLYPKSSFDLLKKLLNNSKIINAKISSNREYLINLSDFEVVDKIEEVINCIEIIDNYSRWLRSSLFKGKFKQEAEINMILKQNQTLESFSEGIGYLNRDIGAIDLALRNNIKETDIDLEGGLLFRFNYYNQNMLLLNSVVDNLNEKNLLGKDIDSKLSFSVDDLKVLSPEDTFYQSCLIISSLKKGDNPEFYNVGFDKSTLSNKNIVNTMFPSFIRQLYNIVANDDTIASFKISNIFYLEDSLNIEIIFRSWLNNEIKQVVNGN